MKSIPLNVFSTEVDSSISIAIGKNANNNVLLRIWEGECQVSVPLTRKDVQKFCDALNSAQKQIDEILTTDDGILDKF